MDLMLALVGMSVVITIFTLIVLAVVCAPRMAHAIARRLW